MVCWQHLTMMMVICTASAVQMIRVGKCANGMVEVSMARAQKLNAVDDAMLRDLEAIDRPMILTSSEASHFCAGGDIAALAKAPTRAFLEREARLLRRLRRRPNVAISEGVTFGFGAGLFVSCPSRVATRKTVLAMPECKIGLVPDAGSLSFLSEYLGADVAKFVALAGYRLSGADLRRTGLATHYSEKDATVSAELKELPVALVPAFLDRFYSKEAKTGLSPLFSSNAVRAAVGRVFQQQQRKKDSSVGDILHALREERAQASAHAESCAWRVREQADAVCDVLDDAIDAISTASPLALETTLQLMEKIEDLGVALVGGKDEEEEERKRAFCSKCEVAVNARLIRRADFQTGVASVLRKTSPDDLPAWSPPTLEEARGLASRLVDDVIDEVIVKRSRPQE